MEKVEEHFMSDGQDSAEQKFNDFAKKHAQIF